MTDFHQRAGEMTAAADGQIVGTIALEHLEAMERRVAVLVEEVERVTNPSDPRRLPFGDGDIDRAEQDTANLLPNGVDGDSTSAEIGVIRSLLHQSPDPLYASFQGFAYSLLAIQVASTVIAVKPVRH